MSKENNKLILLSLQKIERNWGMLNDIDKLLREEFGLEISKSYKSCRNESGDSLKH